MINLLINLLNLKLRQKKKKFFFTKNYVILNLLKKLIELNIIIDFKNISDLYILIYINLNLYKSKKIKIINLQKKFRNWVRVLSQIKLFIKKNEIVLFNTNSGILTTSECWVKKCGGIPILKIILIA